VPDIVSAMTAVEVKQLTKRFETVTAVDGIDLRIESGELFFLLGPSGCGKTTLLRMVAGFVDPTAGRIFVDGDDVTKRSPSKRGMAMVFQSYALWPHMTVRENVSYGLKIQKLPKATLRARADEALAAVQLDALADRRPNALSGGQQQRVALARALVVRPSVLLLDEPLSNLDARLRQDMRAEIRRICKDANLTGIYVTHDQDEALSMADRIALLKDGKVVQCAPPLELYAKPRNQFTAQFLGDTNLVKGEATAGQDGSVLVSTPLGVLKSTVWHGEQPPTGQVTCSIRPESFVPSSALQGYGTKTDSPNTVSLTCTGSVFLGDRVRLNLSGHSGHVVMASVSRPHAVAASEGTTHFAIDPSEVVVLASS
jgi:iron(III) transport system ATP-binding protein